MVEKHGVISSQSRNRLVKISLYVQSGIPVIVEICSDTPPMNMHDGGIVLMLFSFGDEAGLFSNRAFEK